MTAAPESDPEAWLRALGGRAGPVLDIAGAALALAALDRPQVPWQRYREHLRLMVADARRTGAEAVPDAARLGEVIAGRHGYQGDSRNYDDLQNANLMRVIDRRRGLPVALGILYIHVARAQGWRAGGLNVPNHFLIRIAAGGERWILDPFDGGRILDMPAMRRLLIARTGDAAALHPDACRDVSDRTVLLRLQNNIRLRLLRDQRLKEAARVVERMLLFAPDRYRLNCEAGLIHARIGNLRAAIDHLSRFLDRAPATEPERHRAAAILQSLRTRLN